MKRYRVKKAFEATRSKDKMVRQFDPGEIIIADFASGYEASVWAVVVLDHR